MLSSDTFTQEMLSNPTKLAKAAIDMMEASDSSGAISINDPNNGFVMQLFASTSIYAKLSEKIDYVNGFYYPQRARNAEQLYPHLSEFDYINLMASPATVPFLFEMSKDWIIANSVYYDSNYNKIQIPATSYIDMGGITYSMYYPIDILVNRNTGAVTAFYNTEVSNSLHTLESNILLGTNEYQQNGLNYFQITFNMFQFERSVKTYTVGSEQGFIRTFSYDDQFYAAKVFTLLTTGEWKELSYSLTQMYYDYKTPTARLSLLTDKSEVKIEIPQIYFDNRQISQTIKVELYTTKGKVNYALSVPEVRGLRSNFDTTSSPFAAPLAQMPTWTLIPTTIDIEGGSDSMGYQEVRDAVVNQRLYSRVAITTPELIEAGRKAGFTLTRLVDDLTERMYFASNTLIDSNNMAIPTFTGNVLIQDDSLNGDPDTILKYTDGYYTILPTTTFKVSDNNTTCVPLTNGQVSDLRQMPKAELVDELNSGNYVRQPFHITLLTTAKSPAAAIYNLLSPEMKNLSFIRENPNSAPQISVTSCLLEHKDNGTGGYQIRMSAARSSNIKTAAAGNFDILLCCKTKLGEDVYYPAEYIGQDSYQNDIWQAVLSTNYHITADDHITVMMYDSANTLNAVEIPLEHKFTILTAFTSTFEPTIPVDPTLNGLLPIPYVGNKVVMTQQEMTLKFGQNLSNQIYCGVNTSWGNDVYAVASDTVYHTTNVPIFQTNETGVIETKLNNDSVEVVILYPIGSTPSATGDIEFKVMEYSYVTGDPTLLTIEDNTGLLVGMDVRGPNIPVGTKIADIDGNVILLDQIVDHIIPEGTLLQAHNPHGLYRTIIDQDESDLSLISIPSTEDILVGQSVFGFGIPDGAKVISIESDTKFKIDVDATEAIATNTLLTILNTTNHGVIKIATGDIVTDSTGAPVVVKAAQNRYSIPAIFFDGRLFSSDDPTDMEVVETIASKLQNYANQIYTIDAGLIEDADVFYKPDRTMGLATFGIGNNETIKMPLTLGFSVTVYVDVAVYNTSVLLSTMTQSIYQIINEEIQNPIIAISDIASVIAQKLGNNVTAVEMEGFNGSCDLRLIALEESNCTPSIEYKLFLNSDNTITRAPNIRVTYIPKPETIDTVATNKL